MCEGSASRPQPKSTAVSIVSIGGCDRNLVSVEPFVEPAVLPGYTKCVPPHLVNKPTVCHLFSTVVSAFSLTTFTLLWRPIAKFTALIIPSAIAS
jgi:hypothetical protein